MALLIGCGSDAARCNLEGHTFLATYARINGDCPNLEARLSMPGENIPDGCDQTIEYGDSCDVSQLRSCVTPLGDHVSIMHRLHPTAGGFAGTAQTTLVSTEPGVSCSSLYAVTFDEQ